LIQHRFMLAKDLSDQYARFIFLSVARIETDDKRLRFLSAADFEYFASVLMTKWASEKQFLEVDSKFKEELHECANNVLGDKDILGKYRHAVFEKIRKSVNVDRHVMFQHKLGIFLKALFKIASGLCRRKAYEDLFEDIEEKLAEPCYKINLTVEVVDRMMTSVWEAADLVGLRFVPIWCRYVDGIQLCLRHMVSVKEVETRDHPSDPLDRPTARVRSLSFSSALQHSHAGHSVFATLTHPSLALHGHISHPQPHPTPAPLSMSPSSSAVPTLPSSNVTHAALAHSLSQPSIASSSTSNNSRKGRTKVVYVSTGASDLRQ